MYDLATTETLRNGDRIPRIGFGTWLLDDGDECYNAVADDLRLGYRTLTPLAYGNEASVGRAVRDSGIPREQIFVTSKLPAEAKQYEKAVEEFETTMSEIGLDYLDLYLVHAPWPWDEIGKDCRAENREIWKAMEEFLAGGRVRAIGVSNFDTDDLEHAPGLHHQAHGQPDPLVRRARPVSDGADVCRARHRRRSVFAVRAWPDRQSPGDLRHRCPLPGERAPTVRQVPVAQGCRRAAEGDQHGAHRAERAA